MKGFEIKSFADEEACFTQKVFNHNLQFVENQSHEGLISSDNNYREQANLIMNINCFHFKSETTSIKRLIFILVCFFKI